MLFVQCLLEMGADPPTAAAANPTLTLPLTLPLTLTLGLTLTLTLDLTLTLSLIITF